MSQHEKQEQRNETTHDVLASKLTRLAAHLLRQRTLGLPLLITDEALQVMRDAAAELETTDGAHGL